MANLHDGANIARKMGRVNEEVTPIHFSPQAWLKIA
jgi:hypothetical protein